MQSIQWDGNQIDKDGAYRGIPLAIYHRPDLCHEVSTSSSFYRDLNKSPAHAFERSRFNAAHVDDAEQSESMALGRFVHAAVAGEPFDHDCVLRPATVGGVAYNGNTKVWRDWKAAQIAAGKYIMTPEMVERAKGMIIALGKFPLVQQGILGGAPERSLIWRNKYGFFEKARPDDIPNDSGDFVDLKTTKSVAWRDLQKAIVEYGYIQQAALVMEGATALGLPATSFTFLFVESKAPFCVRAVTMKDEDIARGHALNELARKTFLQCYQSKHWPGPGDDHADAEYIDLPDWYRKSVDDRVKFALRENP
ncbi:PD-(D/E)XK nuclease-like domain-containing protein [Bradyrhizobium liaoningense]|uniref:PD-(D/E)XK nuclease-like domain-containing protein n=1 Tax=Bradyrhizobium liaoningense TaxID=43992 RepID=UPI001BAA72B6|nr:PD-(D/E)XK nuclease-like domain-containing protein [Bradyrhizobium liaoningense]MBR0941021.1 PD-(D/E)XK nuclease-like domain-containing protein [Bradyrhizobium liaoningense]